MWTDLLCPAKANRFIDALLHECQLACILYHDDALVTEVKLLLARPIPIHFRCLVQLDVTKQQVVFAPTDHLLVQECLEFVNIIAYARLHADTFVVTQSTH